MEAFDAEIIYDQQKPLRTIVFGFLFLQAYAPLRRIFRLSAVPHVGFESSGLDLGVIVGDSASRLF